MASPMRHRSGEFRLGCSWGDARRASVRILRAILWMGCATLCLSGVGCNQARSRPQSRFSDRYTLLSQEHPDWRRPDTTRWNWDDGGSEAPTAAKGDLDGDGLEDRLLVFRTPEGQGGEAFVLFRHGDEGFAAPMLAYKWSTSSEEVNVGIIAGDCRHTRCTDFIGLGFGMEYSDWMIWDAGGQRFVPWTPPGNQSDEE